LRLTGMAGSILTEARRGKNIRHLVEGLFRRSVFGCLAGYEDVTRRIIAAIGLNRRALDSRRLPNDRLLAPDRVLARSRTHRAPHPKTPNRVVGTRFRSKHKPATIFGGSEGSSGKSRLIRPGRKWCCRQCARKNGRTDHAIDLRRGLGCRPVRRGGVHAATGVCSAVGRLIQIQYPDQSSFGWLRSKARKGCHSGRRRNRSDNRHVGELKICANKRR
jgi:hypothetical protein